jgi:hexosaminidase
VITLTTVGGQKRISITTEISGLEVHYAFDESYPDAFYPKYAQPLEIPKGANKIRAISVRDGKTAGKMITIDLKDLTKRKPN